MASTIVCAVDVEDGASSRPALDVAVDSVAGGEAAMVAPAPAIAYPLVLDAGRLDEFRDEGHDRVARLLAQWGVENARPAAVAVRHVADLTRVMTAWR